MGKFAKSETRHFGKWSLASNPSDQVVGVLEEVEPGDFRLDLSGSLRVDGCESSDDVPGEHRLVGHLESGKEVTLENCHCSPSGLWSNAPRQTWYPHAAIFGASLEANEPWAFYGATFSIPGLTQWVCRATAGFDITKDENGKPNGLGLLVSLESWNLWIHEGVTVELVRSVGTKQIGEVITQLESRINLRAYSSNRLTDDDFQRVATRPLQVLVALATGGFTSPIAGSVALDPHSPAGGNRYHEWRWQPLKVELDSDRVRYGFHHSDLIALGSEVLQRWAQRSATLRPVFDLYLAVLQKTGFAELKFVMVAQALEVHHRVTTSTGVVDQTLWEPIAAKLKQTLEADLASPTNEEPRQRLVGKLRHLNDVTLAQRLKALLDLIPEHRTAICGEKCSLFVRRIVNTRNFFTHWSERDDDVALERGPELVFGTYRLIALLELVLLREAGFAMDSPAAAEVIRRRIAWIPPSGKR